MWDQKYQPVYRLNHSEYGEVVLLEGIERPGQWALQKVIHGLSKQTKTALAEKLAARTRMRHPNLVQLMDYQLPDHQDNISITLEYSPYSSLNLVVDSADPVFRWLLDTLEAVAYLNRLEYVHGDLRPEYVMFFPEAGVFKVADKFALSGNIRSKVRQCVIDGKQVYVSPKMFDLSMKEHLGPSGESDQFKEESFAIGMACLRVWMGNQLDFGAFYDADRGAFNCLTFRQSLDGFRGLLEGEKEHFLFDFLVENLLCLDEDQRKTPQEALDLLLTQISGINSQGEVRVDPSKVKFGPEWTRDCRRIVEGDPEYHRVFIPPKKVFASNRESKVFRKKSFHGGHKRMQSINSPETEEATREPADFKKKSVRHLLGEARVTALVTNLKNRWENGSSFVPKLNRPMPAHEFLRSKGSHKGSKTHLIEWMKKIRIPENPKGSHRNTILEPKRGPLRPPSGHPRQPVQGGRSEKMATLLNKFSQSKKGSFGPIFVQRGSLVEPQGRRGPVTAAGLVRLSKQSYRSKNEESKPPLQRFLSITIEESDFMKESGLTGVDRILALGSFQEGLSIVVSQQALTVAKELEVLHSQGWEDLHHKKLKIVFPFPETKPSATAAPPSDQAHPCRLGPDFSEEDSVELQIRKIPPGFPQRPPVSSLSKASYLLGRAKLTNSQTHLEPEATLARESHRRRLDFVGRTTIETEKKDFRSQLTGGAKAASRRTALNLSSFRFPKKPLLGSDLSEPHVL